MKRDFRWCGICCKYTMHETRPCQPPRCTRHEEARPQEHVNYFDPSEEEREQWSQSR